MGYIAHHTIVVTGFGRYIEAAHAKAIEIFGQLVSPLLPAVINSDSTFVVAPDGSKEGWDESNVHDDKRDDFTDWLRIERGCDWVEVRFGGDEPDLTAVVSRHNGMVWERRREQTGNAPALGGQSPRSSGSTS